MSRQVRRDWFWSIGQLRRQSTLRPTAGSFPLHRRLRFEPLEDRRLLANVTVSNTNDVVNGTTTSIAALILNNGGDGISLREVSLAANADNTDTADIFGFVAAVTAGLRDSGRRLFAPDDSLRVESVQVPRSLSGIS